MGKARAPYQTVFPRFKFDLGAIASDLSQGVELSMGSMEAKLKYWVWQEFGDIKSPEVEVDLQEPLLVV